MTGHDTQQDIRGAQAPRTCWECWHRSCWWRVTMPALTIVNGTERLALERTDDQGQTIRATPQYHQTSHWKAPEVDA